MDGLSLKIGSAEETIKSRELLVFSSLQRLSVSAMMIVLLICFFVRTRGEHIAILDLSFNDVVAFCISNAGEKEIEELKFEKEENDRFYEDEQRKTANLIEKKGECIALLSVQGLSLFLIYIKRPIRGCIS